MLKSKIKNLLIVSMLLLIVLTGTSMASDYTCKVSLLANNESKVKRGESITLLVKATDIQAGEGIASFNAELDYDSDVFDCDISGGEEWDKTSFMEGALFMNRSDYLASAKDQTIAKIVLTAKSDASIGDQTIELTGMEFSTGSETFSVDNVSCTIAVVADSGNNEDRPTNPGNTTPDKPSDDNNSSGGNTNSGNNAGGGASNGGTSSGGTGGSSSGSGSTSGSGSSSSTPKKSTSGGGTSTIANVSSSTTSIPKTGVTDLLIIGAIIGSIIAVIFYIKYKRAYE